MFYLTTHSTHFYLRLYGVTHMVKDHTDSERGNPLPPNTLLLKHIYTFDLSLNLPFITIYKTIMLHLLTIYIWQRNNSNLGYRVTCYESCGGIFSSALVSKTFSRFKNINDRGGVCVEGGGGAMLLI